MLVGEALFRFVSPCRTLSLDIPGLNTVGSIEYTSKPVVGLLFPLLAAANEALVYDLLWLDRGGT